MISSSLAAVLAAALAQSAPQTPPAAPPPAAAAAPSPAPNPFVNLLPNLGKDARSLTTAVPMIVLAAGGVGTIAAHNNDEKIRDWAVKQPYVPGLAHAGNFAGDAYVQSGLAVAAWLTGRQTKNVRLENTGADLIRAQVLNGALTVPIKYIVQRDRPDQGKHSFPSGHTSATFATAAVVQRDYGVTASVPFYALGAVVSWSRIRTNHHWLSDDVFGAAIGIASGLAVTRGNAGKWSVRPVKTAGGAAIYFTRR